jgi:tRNA threonylcarbamoyladenosine biosynthesis protein TsaB
MAGNNCRVRSLLENASANMTNESLPNQAAGVGISGEGKNRLLASGAANPEIAADMKKTAASAPKGPYLLALETATVIGSVAVFSGENLLGSIDIRREKSHARLLAPMIRDLLEDLQLTPAELDAVAVAKGPGSYTGLRVGVSTAKGLCMALDKPLLSMSSLEGLAWQVQELAAQLDAWICPMIDARRMEVYCEVFDNQMVSRQKVQARIIDATAFDTLLAERKVIFLGDGAAKCKPVLGHMPNALFLSQTLSTAASMGTGLYQRYQAGSFEDLVSFEPFYLKDFVATKPKNPLFR